MMSMIVQLLAGAAGGNVAGSLMKDSSMGTLWNSVAGILGGGIGGQVLGMLMPSVGAAAASGAMDMSSILASVAGGGVGGGIVMAVIGMIKKAMG